MKKQPFIFIVSLILFYSAIQHYVIPMLDNSSRTDFYLVWAVEKHHSLSGKKLGNIYPEETRIQIAREIKELALNLKDLRLFHDSIARQDLNLCATPFFFSVFRFFNSGFYTEDLDRFSWFSLVCFSGAFFLGSFVFSIPLSYGILFCSLCLIFYRPLISSLSLGNVNEILLFSIISLFYMEKRFQKPAASLLSGLGLSLLCFLKPLFVFSWALWFLGKCIFSSYRKAFYFAAGSLLGALGALIMTHQMFDVIAAWKGWLNYMLTLDLTYWSRFISFGNFSLSAGMYEWLHMKPVLMHYLCCLGLGTGCLIYLKKAKGHQDLAFSEQTGLFWLGQAFFILTSPLFWAHYFTLALIPLFQLFCLNGTEKISGILYRISLFLLVWFSVGDRTLWENIPDLSPVAMTLSISLPVLLLYGSVTVMLISPNESASDLSD
ncbi:MAG: hypothetical protein JW774_08800 [Candidatus Aureabacteria bacterium]|nr:hypothetical protein [Candidatus Auribacterota bacterium]